MDVLNEGREFLATASSSYLLLVAGGAIVFYVILQLAADVLKKIVVWGWKYTVPFLLFAIWFYGFHIPLYKRFIEMAHELHEQNKQEV